MAEASTQCCLSPQSAFSTESSMKKQPTEKSNVVSTPLLSTHGPSPKKRRGRDKAFLDAHLSVLYALCRLMQNFP
jgi:hypothetical protein